VSLRGQVGRFLLVGVSNTLVSIVVYRLLLRLGVPYVAGAALAFAAGAANGYVLNRRWTFRAEDTWAARGSYVAVQALGFVASALLVWGLVELGGLGERSAQLVSIPLVTAVTFLLARQVVFRRRAAATTTS
jgi:putative flippase GtrA